MNSEQKSIEAATDYVPRRLPQMVERFRQLIRNETLHLWMADAFLSKNPNPAPMMVERGETFNENLQAVFGALSDTEKNRFISALSRVVDPEATPRLWPPPESLSQARALRDLMRLAKLSRHYGMLSWTGGELIRLLKQPKTPSDLKILSDVVVMMGEVPKWVPETERRGPNYQKVLGELHKLFLGLGNSGNLSFLDAAFLLPAVTYDPDNWHSLVCAALKRYDVRGSGTFPEDWPFFGGPSYPEGAGLYDIRVLIVRVVRERLTLTQYNRGVRALVDNRAPRDNESKILIGILGQLGLLNQLPNYIPLYSEAAVPSPPVMQLADIFFLGPDFIDAVHRGLFQFVDESALDEWCRSNWALATAPLDMFLGNLAKFPPIAIWASPLKEFNTYEPVDDEAAAERIQADQILRNFGEYITQGAAAIITRPRMH